MSAKPYTGTEPHAYVTYPREDLRLIQPELDRLAELGIRIDFPDEADDAKLDRVRAAAFVLVLVSDSVAEDAALRKELSAALQEGKEVWAVHVVDVPLDGAIKLLLGSVNELAKHKLSNDEYVRRLVRVLPEEVKTRKIELPGEPPPPPASRPRPAQDPVAGLQSTLAGLGNAPLIVLGVLAVIVVGGGLVGLMRTPHAPEVAKTQAAEGEKTADDPDAGLSPEELERRRAERAAEAERRKQEREAARKREEEQQAAAEAARSAREQALKAFEEGEYAKAVELATPLLQARPEDAELALLRARSHARLGKDREAAADFGVVLKQAPQHTDALWGRGEALLRAGDAQGAAADFEALLKLRAKDAFAWIALGDARGALSDWPAAIAAYDRAIELTPRSPLAFQKRGQAKAKLGDASGAADDQAKARELRSR